MKFKLNVNSLFTLPKDGRIDSFDLALKAFEAVKAVAYLIEVAEVQINEDLYNRIAEDGKKYFIGIKEEIK